MLTLSMFYDRGYLAPLCLAFYVIESLLKIIYRLNGEGKGDQT